MAASLKRIAFTTTGIVLLGLSTFAYCTAADPGGTATKAQPRNDEWWQNLHNSFLERAKKPVDLLFVGDSITQGWGENDVWKEFYSKRNPANFGIGGDQTGHVLWRLENDELKGISPKVAVVMIGTNNVGGNTPDEIAEGIKAIVASLRSKLPQTKVLLLGVFPRGENLSKDFRDNNETTKVSRIPAAINAGIAKQDDGKNVRYLDITKAFLNEEGIMSKEVMPDFIHLSPKGYRIWAEAMEPLLKEMLGEKP